MVLIFLFFDILIYLTTSYKTFLVLMIIPLIAKKDWFKIISVGILTDLVIYKNIFLTNTIVYLLIFLINKYVLKVKKLVFSNYLLINIFNLILYILIFYFMTKTFNFLELSLVIFKILSINFIIWLLGYKALVKFIK